MEVSLHSKLFNTQNSQRLVDMYHSYPPNSNTSDKAIIHLTDIFGLPLLQNKLYVFNILAHASDT